VSREFFSQFWQKSTGLSVLMGGTTMNVPSGEIETMKNQRKHGFRKALMLALGVFGLMSVEQRVQALPASSTWSYSGPRGHYYQQQQALTLVERLRIRAQHYLQQYYRQQAMIMNTRADQIRIQQRHLAAVRQMRWNYQQYRKVMEHIKKLQQQQNGSGNYQTVKR
jgi:hypothetical protein